MTCGVPLGPLLAPLLFYPSIPAIKPDLSKQSIIHPLAMAGAGPIDIGQRQSTSWTGHQAFGLWEEARAPSTERTEKHWKSKHCSVSHHVIT